MRFNARNSILVLIAGAIVAISAPAAAQAAFGVEKFFAANCKATHESCGEEANEGNQITAEEQGYVVAGGHVPFGVTDFKVKTFEPFPGLLVPEGNVRTVRVDVAPGVVTNPQAVPKCPLKDFTSEETFVNGVYLASTCPKDTIIGTNIVTVVGEPEGFPEDLELEGTVYNLEQSTGLSSFFGVALQLKPLKGEIKGLEEFLGKEVFSHTLIEGNVEWASDYHDYFIIKNIPTTPPLVESRLIFKGNVAGTSGLVRNPSACVKPGPATTTGLTVESYKGEVETRPYKALVGTEECEAEHFSPSFTLNPETTLTDQPDGIEAKLTTTHPEEASETDTSDLKTATLTLPEGLTMNPSAGAGLAGCTPEQIGIGTRNSVTCPSGSRIGTVNLEVPTLPPGSLQGPIFLGKPAGKSIEGPPYTIYLDAESARYGVKVRLKGTITPNATTGQLTTTFSENPEAPFNEAILHFNGGAFAPLANPLVCSTGQTKIALAPFSGTGTLTTELPFATGGCASSPPPFSPTQSTSVSPVSGGTDTGFTFSLTRPEGTQYVEKVRTVLPPGVVGKIPTVPLCSEPQAAATQVSGKGCSSASQIGTVNVTAGSGEPYPFTGTVYLTGPYEGAPYGLAFKVPVVAGPFNLGEEVTRAKIEVEPYSSRVIVTSTLPTIRAGIPVRLRSLNVNVSRPNYLLNPTNCQLEAVESTLTSTLKATANLSTPFQAEGCSTLAFKPAFSAKTSGKTSKANGASLETTINQPAGQANIKSVLVTLPKQLPSRLTTLQKACPEATFAANPLSCPAGSMVGSARANTPALPTKMTGPAIFVSHGGEAFPDLDLVLEADGIRVIVVGNTKITHGITTTNFATTPDVPVSSITVNLPAAPNSALGANGSLCVTPLVMPTTITGQNGLQVKQNTKIAVTGCGVQIVGHKVIGNTAYLTVKTFAAGRISATGSGVSSVFRTLNGASNATTLKVSLRGRRRPFSTKIRVGFVAKSHKVGNSSATVRVRF
jgi:hypothetical protein